MEAEQLIAAFAPLTRYVAMVDLRMPEVAMLDLESTFPVRGLERLKRAVFRAHEEGWLTPREAGANIRFGRLSKPCEQTHSLSIDAVEMSGAGAPHTHPKGEVSLCFELSGTPRFMGHPEGWVVVGPGSSHTPRVNGGRMLIVYFLPDGEMHWDNTTTEET